MQLPIVVVEVPAEVRVEALGMEVETLQVAQVEVEKFSGS